MSDWTDESQNSSLEFGKNGMSNTYRLDEAPKLEEQPKINSEYITIYNPHGSFKSKLLSLTMIVAILVFCWLLFRYIYSDKPDSSAAAASQTAHASASQSVK